MADLEDGPDQRPLAETNIYKTIINLIKGSRFDLVITHSPGESTRGAEDTKKLARRFYHFGGAERSKQKRCGFLPMRMAREPITPMLREMHIANSFCQRPFGRENIIF